MSKVLKPNSYITLDDRKFIDVAEYQPPAPEAGSSDNEGRSQAEQEELNQQLLMKNQILQDAEAVAEAQVRQAMEEAAALKEQALAEIEDWWMERRELDGQVVSEASQSGFDAGYKEGYLQAEAAVQEQYIGMVAEAKTVLEQAYEMKRQIIKEAEPFLIELSTAIAEKIIQQELRQSPEIMVQITRTVLARRRDKGIVTLCVAPEHFAYIRDARDELQLVVDSQAELQILPDSSVGDHGCVVRTEFGSIDARVDTQLKEIRQALQQLAIRDEGADDHE